MADLDDGLNTSAPVWAPAALDVDWKEQQPNLFFSENPDRLNDMTRQMTGAFTVEHSLEDGLPDPVTMTTSADASGQANIPLLGRDGITAQTWGWRTSTTEGGTGASQIFFLDWPTDMKYGDYAIVGVALNSTTVLLNDYNDPDNQYEAWKLLAEIVDGTIKLFVFGKRFWDGESGFFCNFSETGLSYTAMCSGAYARAMDPDIWVDLVPQTVQTLAEPSVGAVTLHTTPEVPLRRRGFCVSVWATPTGNAPFTYTGGGSELAEITTPIDLMMAASPLRTPGDYALTANTTVATNVVAMVTIALEIFDRPYMDARSYFSPFNKTSPVYGYARDTAETELFFNVITPNGPVATTLHKGQMADIGIKGRIAELDAISKTRIDLDTSLTLPVIFGDRENCSIDWLATWAMARGGQWVGPSPGALTRYWAPMYGSTHAHFDSEYAYNGALYWTAIDGGPYGLKPPSVVEGPFLTAMYAQQKADRTEEIFLDAKRLDLTDPLGLPTQDAFLDPPMLRYDQFSQVFSQGRLAFWIRGDPAVSAPSYLGANDDFLFKYNLYCMSPSNAFLGWVIVTVRSSDRMINVYMGSDTNAGGSVTFSSVGALPTDGSWNFVGVAWDFKNGAAKAKLNAAESTSTYWFTNGMNVSSQLYATDAALIAAGGRFDNYARFHLPGSDLQIESGSPAYGNSWARHYPIPEGLNATMRPTYQTIEAVAEATPIQGWELLSQLARASMSSYRCNEIDNFEFLPLTYFGEAAQLTPTVIADTEVNAGELNVITDPSKTRNVVTIKFDETRVSSNYGPVFTLSTAIAIPRGTSVMTFALDVPAAEIHGQSQPFGSTWTLTNLSPSHITTPSTIDKTKHYMSVNINQDGSGAMATNLVVVAKIVSVTASTVTISFTSKYYKPLWLVNNGDQVPFLQILGYAVTSVDGYVTERDAGSVGTRRERALDTEVSWVHNRDEATKLAQLMVTALARPRPEVQVTVMGDPRRAPGQLVSLRDAQGTQADGSWRVLAVKHNADGPQYTQDLQLAFVPPIGVWDGEPGWDEEIWAE